MSALAELRNSDRATFVGSVGAAFEDSPWVAEAAWEEGPFATVADLHAAMVRAVERAPAEARLELIRAHPELAYGEAPPDGLTSESAAEQAGAGLDRLTRDQADRLERATAEYRSKFGFPFVICVREHAPEGIIQSAERRLASTAGEEIRTALAEIAKIARLRLEDSVGEREE